MKEFYRAFRVRQPAAALAKSFYFACGFRPLVVKITGLNAGGSNGLAVNGVMDAGDMLLDTGAAVTTIIDDAVTFDERGFTMGTNSEVFSVDGKSMLIEAWGDPRIVAKDTVIDLTNSLPLRDDKSFAGDGDQFDASINADGSGTYNPEFSDSGVFRTS